MWIEYLEANRWQRQDIIVMITVTVAWDGILEIENDIDYGILELNTHQYWKLKKS